MIHKQQKNNIKNYKSTPQTINETYYNAKGTNEYHFT